MIQTLTGRHAEGEKIPRDADPPPLAHPKSILLIVRAREAKANTAIQLEDQLDCFGATLLAMTGLSFVADNERVVPAKQAKML